MLWDGKPGASRAPVRVVVRYWGLSCVIAGMLLLAGCNGEQSQTASLATPRGASVAFESIDGPPPAVFQKLVNNLNTEAQARRLAVVSRDGQSAYRVRGYLAARKEQRVTAISWVWDVYDGELKRGLRIAGEEKVRGDGWAAADDAALQRIASASMTRLAAFLTSPDIAPGQQTAAGPAPSSPEANGIFRISQVQADPVAGADETAAVAHRAGPVPLPPHRPKRALSAAAALTLAAAD
jgi:hypothetical protein